MSPMQNEIAKPLPQNTDAERALLGAALTEPSAAIEILSMIRPEDFFHTHHKTILRQIEAVHASGSAPDLVTVTDSLRTAGKLEEAGGAAYLSSLLDGAYKIRNIAHYADLVKQKAQLRKLIFSCNAISQSALNGTESAEQLIESAVSQVLSVADDGGSSIVSRQWDDVAQSALKAIEKAMREPEAARRINFGLTDLDDMTGGLRPKELVLIVAPTSNGKTLLASQCALRADRDGFKTLYFSAEMPGEQLALREIAYQAGVPFYFVQRPEKLNADNYASLVNAANRECSMRIIDRDITPARIFAMAEAAKRTHGLDMVIVDYDQLAIEAGIDPDSDDENVFRHQRGFVFRAKKLAERLNICFVLISQLRKGKLSSAVQKGAHPHLDDIWGDSSIRNTPHLILWLSRDFFTHNMDLAYERQAHVYVLKNRNGRTGVVTLEFDPERVRFFDAPPTEADSVAETVVCGRDGY
ncbi:MAG TPA: DnaB-like helicase C-terminal domain-containing protein [Candidatus Acidoferrales bacterium]|nr:DnaB-like helicase C-terminal domain-containing protein [Candidatus Acidoferrales bacterium]